MTIHHSAYRQTESVPLCGTFMPGDELSLNNDRIDCPPCREIAGIGDQPEDDGIECSNCTPDDREDCEHPENGDH